MIFIAIFFPIVAGLLLLAVPSKHFTFTRKSLCGYTGGILVTTCILVLTALIVTPDNVPYTLFNLSRTLPILFKVDGVGRFFVTIVSIIWVLSGFYSFSYMKHESHERRYYGFYLIVYGVLIGLDFSGNLVTFYMFYELMTLLSIPLVLHTQTREAIMAGLKYLFYSFCGAYMALFGLYFLNRYANTLTFTAGGVLDLSMLEGHEELLLIVAFVMLLGFGVKAGMFPLHAWLPTAHPVAPAPASAVLSGIIAKSGVLAAIRVVYYLFGTSFLRGTWVQEAWLILILITVLMGSMMAYREKGLKKRLAYSTVSQISYILLGLAMMQSTAFTGSMLHTAAHAIMKCGLFLIAGAIICQTGKTRVEELRGIGKEMPITMWCYLIFSLSLIGIPPFSGFTSKWYLGNGSMAADMPVFSVLAPIILLISALLTAGYMLPIAIHGFLPGEDYDYKALVKKEPSAWMLVPILILAVLTVLLGVFPGQLIQALEGMGGSLL